MPFLPASRRIISIHALREEGDISYTLTCAKANIISIHALREEGDRGLVCHSHGSEISIHALREEGDSKNREKIPAFIPL